MVLTPSTSSCGRSAGGWNQISPIGFEVREDGSLGRFGFKAPNLGESFYRQRPVSEVILAALPVTLLLNLVSIPLTYSIAIFVGIQAAKHRGKSVDVSTGANTGAPGERPPLAPGAALWSAPNFLYMTLRAAPADGRFLVLISMPRHALAA